MCVSNSGRRYKELICESFGKEFGISVIMQLFLLSIKALKLLMCVSNSGRRYKGLICESFGKEFGISVIMQLFLLSSAVQICKWNH